MFETYQLNPAISLNVFSEEKFQFRFPNANHVTIHHSPEYYEKIIQKTGVYKPEEWIEVISGAGVPDDETEAVFSTLTEIGVLVDGRRKISNLMDALLAHEDTTSNFARKEFQLPSFETVSVLGSGAIADAVRTFLNGQLGLSPGEDGDMRIVVCDEENIAQLSALWEKTKGSKFATALWSDGVSYRVGPLWVPGESACYECFLDRTRASSQFPDEFESLRTNHPIGAGRPDFTEGQMGLLNFVLERYFRLVGDGFFNVIEPGTIENWNFFVGDRKVQRVLRNPYCSHCSVGTMSSRAVRDLI